MADADRGIERLREELAAVEARIVQRLDGADQRFAALDAFAARADQRFAALDERLDTLCELVQATAADLRRHFDVIAESLTGMIRLVADGVATVDDKLERFRDETRGNFERVDRRFLRLEVRVSALERR